MAKVINIKADESLKPSAPEIQESAIIGTFEGECADASITNLNGLDITQEVWEKVFDSAEYKKAIKYGWYIGFLGHPAEDADCQDFRRACIVMTDGSIAPNGKVHGKFNLVGTPVGKIVKVFQDAGVKFGISVRGAGDVINNSVDPDTFVFRGFDLVTFPAFPNSIPDFTEIAASTDNEKRKKYQKICAAVRDNLDALDTVSAVNVIQSCFAKQSEEYNILENRKKEIEGKAIVESSEIPEDDTEVDPRVESMVSMYLDLKAQYDTLLVAHRGLEEMYDNLVKDNERRVEVINRVCSSQMNDLHVALSKVEAASKSQKQSILAKDSQIERLQRQLERSNRNLSRIQSSLDIKNREVETLNQRIQDSEEKRRSSHYSFIRANSQVSKVQQNLDATSSERDDYKHDFETSQDIIASLKSQVESLKEQNLKYSQKIESAEEAVRDKESTITRLQSSLSETVRKHAQETLNSSNRDDEVEELKSRVTAAESNLKEYQTAYASMYANAVGARVPQLNVTANTHISALQNMIRSSTSVAMKPDVLEPTQDVDPSYFEADNYNDGDLITV